MRLRGAFWLALLACSPAPAQFSQLAVTDDGSGIYFRTIQRLKADGPARFSQTGAIYRLADGRPSLAHESQSGYPTGDAVLPQVSGDGSVFLFHDAVYCVGGSSCLGRPTAYYPALTIGGVRYGGTLGSGTGQLSRSRDGPAGASGVLAAGGVERWQGRRLRRGNGWVDSVGTAGSKADPAKGRESGLCADE